MIKSFFIVLVLLFIVAMLFLCGCSSWCQVKRPPIDFSRVVEPSWYEVIYDSCAVYSVGNATETQCAENLYICLSSAEATAFYNENGGNVFGLHHLVVNVPMVLPLDSVLLDPARINTLTANEHHDTQYPSGYIIEKATDYLNVPVSTAGNLASNSSFTNNPYPIYAPSYFPPGAATSIFTWATDQVHTGTSSIKIQSTQGPGALSRWSYTTSTPTAPGRTYKATVWAKTQGVTTYAILNMRYFNGIASVVTIPSTMTVKGTTDWTQISVQGIAPPLSNRIILEFMLYGTGTVWFDDVTLE